MEFECPLCANAGQYESDSEGGPSPGDVLVCHGCGGYLNFTDGLTLALMHADALAELGRIEPEFLAVIQQERDRIVDQWDWTDSPPTLFAQVRLNVYRANKRRKAH